MQKHYLRGFFMIQYKKILNLADESLNLRPIFANIGHDRPKFTEILQLTRPNVTLSLLHQQYEASCCAKW